MKISIFTSLGDTKHEPHQTGYRWVEALSNYCDLADEVVLVYGGKKSQIDFENDKLKMVYAPWAWEFSWEEIAKHFNIGLQACTGDWAIKMDIDYFMHERDMGGFKRRLRIAKSGRFAFASFMKFNVLRADAAYEKVHAPFCFNTDFRGEYGFGVPTDDKTSAWGYPIKLDGKKHKNGLPTGTSISENDIFPTSTRVYNYDNSFRTKEQTAEHFSRFARARKRGGFPEDWGMDEATAAEKFREMMHNRETKTSTITKKLALEDHPIHIRHAIEELRPDQYLHSQWRKI